MADLVVPGHDWQSVAEAVRELRGDREVTLKLDGTLTRREWDAWQRVRDSKFYLVRNRGGTTGERYRCSRHAFRTGIDEPVYHEFFTTMCIDRPWRGLEEALFAYSSLTNDERMAERLERTWAPNAARAHPQSFGRQAPALHHGELIAFALGTLEPIAEQRAQNLAALINQRRPPQPFRL